MTTDEKARRGNVEPTGRETRKAALYTLPTPTTAEPDPSRAALGQAAARAAVASIALGEARRAENVADRRERLLLARVQLRKSLKHLDADLERLSA